MAAAKVTVPVNTETSVVSSTKQWSSDGTTGGELQPFVVLSDIAQTAYFTTGNPGFVSAVVTGTVAVTGTFFQATQPISGTITANAGTNLNTSLLALEGGGNLATIVTNTGKIPSQGQALAAASMPVVLTAAQVTTLTPPAAITGFATEATLSTLNGKVTACNTGATVLAAGTAIAGKVGIDQTTPGTTNGVQLPATQAGGVGLGQALAAASVPIVLTAAQLTTLTPLATVAVTQSGAWSLSANQSVNLAQVGGSSTAVGHGVAATALRVELPTDGTGVIAGVTTVTTVTTCAAVTAITNALPAGTNLMGKVGIDQTTVGTTNGVSIVASTVGGASTLHTVVASGTNATNVKASAGVLKGVQVYNNSANIAYLKLYNTAGTPSAGSGTPTKVIMIPASTAGAGAIVNIPPEGIAFATGIGFTVTGGIADNDSTSVAASAYLVEIDYK